MERYIGVSRETVLQTEVLHREKKFRTVVLRRSEWHEGLHSETSVRKYYNKLSLLPIKL